MERQSPTGLNVAIIGAGLVGLFAARVLREQHNVTVYERSQGTNEIGAAVGLSPSVTHILHDLGCDQARVRFLAMEQSKIYNRHGDLVHTVDMMGIKQKLDVTGDYLLSHRRDLHAEFCRLATAPSSDLGISGEPAVIIYGKEVASVEPEDGKIVFRDGKTVTADLIIGADGIKSAVRPCVVGDAAYTTARPSGFSAFRFLLSRDKVIDTFGNIPRQLRKDKPVAISLIDAGDGSHRLIVMYPCRDFELLNIVCIVPDSMLKDPSFESWTAAGDKTELLEHYHDYPDWVKKYIEIADQPRLWQLRDQDPLPTYINGRTIIVGDAAHSMTPHQGQGATQGVEDAEAFRLFLSPATGKTVTRDQVPHVLRDIDSVRRIRASQVQRNTRAAARKEKPEDLHKNERFNWRYPGIVEALNRVQYGESAGSV